MCKVRPFRPKVGTHIMEPLNEYSIYGLCESHTMDPATSLHRDSK